MRFVEYLTHNIRDEKFIQLLVTESEGMTKKWMRG
jgi:hypothetical protein